MGWMSMPPPSNKQRDNDEEQKKEEPAEDPEQKRVGLWLPPNSAARAAEKQPQGESERASSKSAGVGDGGASWRLKAMKRAVERAKAENRSVREELEGRFGSEALGQLAQLESSQHRGSGGGGAARFAHLQAAKQRY